MCALIKPDRVYRVRQHDFVYIRHSFSFESNYPLVRKKRLPQIGNCWVYIYCQRKKFSRIFHLYRISSLLGLARTLEIEYLVCHKIMQSRTIPRTINVFSRTICPQNPAQFLFFSRTLSEGLSSHQISPYLIQHVRLRYL